MNKTGTNILIGGEAGQGLATVGQLLAKSLVRAGYHISVTQDYMSRIRGGHNTFAIRVGIQDVFAPLETVDILVAMNNETVELHKDRLAPDGLVLLDEELDACQARCYPVPFSELAPKVIFENVAALGALAEILGLDREVPRKLLHNVFAKKGEEIIQQNVEVLENSCSWVEANKPDFAPLAPPEPQGERLMINGNEAIALGAMAGGVKFCSFYPMTPATSVAMNLISFAQKMGLVVEQAEDEIAAINMGLGASFAGARTVVPTSGGGFALMTEGVSLAGMLEQPIVVVLAQRPGPATGLPTRTEQGDLNLVLYAGHGEFPRAILTPGDVEQCFHLTHKALDLAERFQGPVFVLTDQYLADNYRAVPLFDLDALPAPVLPGFETDNPAGYERYAITESGVSPRLAPGFGPYLVVADSDEHTPDGHITEDLDVRIQMQNKRLRKGQVLVENLIPPDYLGPDAASTLLVCWGSTKGAAVEAARLRTEQGEPTAVLHFSQVFPLHSDNFLPLLRQAGKTVCVEGNSTSQFAALIRQTTGFEFDTRILRYDGLPFTARYILDHLQDRPTGE